ncbi:phospho-N-acetylmuramoyl-pentapeptide-transferase [Spirochaetia bacterium]|nr:phospho-N-acetylmuramoyl-pentapeptide-transferase [Spirochaetia bacterium]
MFLKFIYPLVQYLTALNVLQYLTFRAAFAAMSAFLLCFLLGPWIINALRTLKMGQSIRTDGPQTHLAKSGTPTMGGILFILSIAAAVILWQDWKNWKVWLALGSLVMLGCIGFIDDYLKVTKHNSDGLPAWAKLAGQFVVALSATLVLYLSGEKGVTLLYLPFFKDPVVDMGLLWIPFAVLLVMGESNAVNFTDGLDGLASGLLIFVFSTLAILSYLSGRVDYSEYLGIPYITGAGELTIFCLTAVGACIGFLWFNAHPAEVIMGDVGSLSMGGTIAVISLILKKEIVVLIAGGVFVLEIASVVIQVVYFKLTKKRVFKMAPLHHHFELSGWKETKVVIRFWILGALFAIIALSTLKIQ